MNFSLEGVQGDAVLVLSNALGTTSAMWDPQIPDLRARFRLFLYDHAALNSIPALAADLLDLLDDSGIERFSFCGLSLGGMVGMQIAVDAPDRLQRLVLACTAARFGEPQQWAEKAALVRRDGMNAVAHDALKKWLTSGYEARDAYLEMQLSMARESYARGLEAIGGFDFRDRLHDIAVPTLVIAGSEDEATTVEDARFIAQHIPDARLVVIEGAAHLPNVERPDRFTEAVLAHVGK